MCRRIGQGVGVIMWVAHPHPWEETSNWEARRPQVVWAKSAQLCSQHFCADAHLTQHERWWFHEASSPWRSQKTNWDSISPTCHPDQREGDLHHRSRSEEVVFFREKKGQPTWSHEGPLVIQSFLFILKINLTYPSINSIIYVIYIHNFWGIFKKRWQHWFLELDDPYLDKVFDLGLMKYMSEKLSVSPEDVKFHVLVLELCPSAKELGGETLVWLNNPNL